MHLLIPHADAVELTFVYIYIYKQLMTYFTGSHEPSLLNQNQMCLLIWIFINVTIYHQFSLIWNIQRINGMPF